MINLSELSIAQLEELKQQIGQELTLRNEVKNKEYDYEFFVSGKARYPATYEQYKYACALAEQTGSSIQASVSQITKRVEKTEISEWIDLMKKGYSIKVS